ncbi:hypothetical protein [Cumulibacter manganitolerans]|uniref:hypothetical protein n=1 Tax=Cumulibacter manganitolerans TaxID=1884992 RepID=UPI001296D532|nr:hypothetical protein [Cumulibacter manganitolerans]
MSPLSSGSVQPGRGGPPRPPQIGAQRDALAAARPARTAQVGEQWELVADLLDELVSRYDDLLEDGPSAQTATAAGAALQDVMDAFDVLGAVSRHNSEVLDDVATELTIAQARMTTIWSDYEAERAAGELAQRAGSIERRYTARAAREVWYPLDGHIADAARRLRQAPARPGQPATGASCSSVVPLPRR